jgi:hypothetical protein
MQSLDALQSLAEFHMHERRAEAERERMLAAAAPSTNLLAARLVADLVDRVQLLRTHFVRLQAA